VIAASLLIAAPAAAQTPDAPPPPPPGAPAQPPAPPPVKARPMSMQPMSMQSAGPGAPQRGPRRGAPAWNKGKRGRVATPMDGSPIASAPSFIRLDDGATRVELEVSSRVDVAENKARGRVVYRLRGAQVGERTNQLPLLTGFFSTPVDRMQLVQQGPDVDLVIDLREASDPTQRVVETPRGIVLQVDFPRSVSFEKHKEAVPDTTSRERARRRNSTQTLGGSGSNGQPPDEDSN
jgi:hypothetical protein